MPHYKNFLLNRLDADVLGRISANLSVIRLEQGEVLAETHQLVEKVYFPHMGIIVVETIGGGAIETGTIGNDGAFGVSQALDDKLSLNHVVMQVPGTASVIFSDHVREVADERPLFRGLLVKYDNSSSRKCNRRQHAMLSTPSKPAHASGSFGCMTWLVMTSS